MDQYCIYLRKSRADAEAEERGEGETLARHEKILLDLAAKGNLYISEIYRELVSGETIAARPVMQQLLSEVENGRWNGVLVVEVERLARGDTIDQGIVSQAFKLSNTKIITPIKTYDPSNEFDEEYFEFGLFMSRREYKTINRRLQRGRIAAVKEGKFVGNKAPYGYIRKKLEQDSGFTLERVPEKSETVRMIFDLFINQDMGCVLVARKLNLLGIPSPKDGKWTEYTIRGIIENPVYCGKVRWNHRKQVKKVTDGTVKIERPQTKNEDCVIAQGLHEPIISEETWEKAQAIFKTKAHLPIKDPSLVKSPLSGLVVCGKCGRKMVRRTYTVGHLPTLLCNNINCDNISSRLDYVEREILLSLENWVREYKLQWESNYQKRKAPPASHKKTVLKKVNQEIKEYKEQLGTIHNLLERGVYSVDVFMERSRTINEKMEQLTGRRTHLEKELQSEMLDEETRKGIIPKIENLLDVYGSLASAKAKNDMLKEVLEKVVYIKNTNGRWHHSPDDFTITLYPRLPKQTD